MGTLFLYAVDPGAFSIMRPMERWGRRHGIAVEWVAEGFAANQLKRNQVPFHSDVQKVIRAAAASDVLLFGSQTDCDRTARLINTANKKSLTNHFLFDHWCFYREHFQLGSRRFLPNGYLFAIDATEKRSLARVGIDRRKIKIVGHPAIWESEQMAANSSKHVVERHRQVLFFSEPNIGFGVDKKGKPLLGFDERDSLLLLAKTLAQKWPGKFDLLVKLHPREDPAILSSFIKGIAKGLRIRLTAVGDPLKMIFESRFVFGITTILLHHALQLGKITGSVQPHRNRKGKENSNFHLDQILVREPADVAKIMAGKNVKALKLNPDPNRALFEHMGFIARNQS